MSSTLRVRRCATILIVMGFTIVLSTCGGAGGGAGDTIFLQNFAAVVPLTPQEVDILVRRAAAAVDSPNMTVAVVDRVGRPLAVWSRNPAVTEDDVNKALSVARTGAFMSSSQGPITSRTLEYISTFHFPPLFGNLTRTPVPNTTLLLDDTLASQRETTDVRGFPQGPLWQIFSSNRGAPYAGADLPAQTVPPTDFLAGQRIPPAGRIDLNGNPIPGVAGPGLTYIAGGVPIYKLGDLNAVDAGGNATFLGRDGLPVPTDQFFPVAANFPARVAGAIGVYITDPVTGDPLPQVAEFAAVRGLQGVDAAGNPTGSVNFAVPANALANPLLQLNLLFPLELVPREGAIFLVGELLPYVDQTTRPSGVAGGIFADDGVNGMYVVAPQAGGTQAFGWIIGPRADPRGNLSAAEVQQIITQGIETADGTRAAIRLPIGSATKMIFAVTNLDGLILGVFRMEDSPVFSYDVSLTKARCVTYLSSFPGGDPDMAVTDAQLLNSAGIPTGIPGTAGEFGVAITTRTLAFLTQPFFPPGIDTSPTVPGPLFRFAEQNADPAQFNRMADAPFVQSLQSGIIFFPGATPLYKNGQLVGGFGVSGDGVEQDDFVTAGGYEGFEPPAAIRADQFLFQNVRLPFFKFPQLPGPGRR